MLRKFVFACFLGLSLSVGIVGSASAVAADPGNSTEQKVVIAVYQNRAVDQNGNVWYQWEFHWSDGSVTRSGWERGTRA
jgi:hypothetical protein